ncbi:MAG TPA: hypothetical protein VFO65_00770 [Acidimicrobiales bacterium]|nr:hypothetical protein [Acidimicrobiales bacterium]
MLECVVNVSEGRRADVVAAVAGAGGAALLDVHTDADHNRSVVTLAGAEVEEAAFAVVAEAVARIDLSTHSGAHPRLGAADVVPFVPLGDGDDLGTARMARDRAAARIARELGVPVFRYGPAPEPSLPELRRRAFVELAPDAGPPVPHPTAGATCVGARPLLVAYNLWLAPPATLADARRIAASLRGPAVRALGLPLAGAGRAQVSCNLVDPLAAGGGPAAVYDAVAAAGAPVERAELVGLVPAAVLHAVPSRRWAELDLDPSRTIEARLEGAGLDGGRFATGGGG